MSERIPESDYAASQPGATELVSIERLALQELLDRVADLEQRLATLHTEAAMCDSIRYRRREQEQLQARAAMAAIGKLAPDERLAKVRAMSAGELGRYFDANTDATVLETLQSATAGERAAWLLHVRVALHDRARLIDEPPAPRVRVELKPSLSYRPQGRRSVTRAQYNALRKAGLGSWCSTDENERYTVQCVSPPAVMEAAHYAALVEAGDPVSDFASATPLDEQTNMAYELDERRRARESSRAG